MAETPPSLEARLVSEGVEISRVPAAAGSMEDAEQTTILAQRERADWLVLDGYQFGADYQHLVKRAGLSLVSVDDYGHASHYYADIVLNQNIHASDALYASREPYTRLLLGPRYILLRREFWRWRSWQREIVSSAHRILVTFGGGDPGNITRQAIAAFCEMGVDESEATVLVGASNPYFEELKQSIRHSALSIRLERNLPDVPEVMAWADLAISAAGSTCWEMAYMGLPSIVLVLADNQLPIAESLERAEVVVNLGWSGTGSQVSISAALRELARNEPLRRKLSDAGKQLVDGNGSRRLVSFLQ
jgi:UDP-2,4-diacetamido-2,4,6-trideoxy-beta-L-altropyranose hydrolase